jgi:hypothetical protein
MSKRNKLNRRPAMTVAVHEAGHAVAAIHFGILWAYLKQFDANGNIKK